jgi:tetratricopeptide (TPR) repeat protein
MTLVAAGFPEDGVREARRCLEALPVDLGENWAMGGVFYLTGRNDEAIHQLLRTLELYPDFRPARQLLALSYWMEGEREKALEAAARSEPANGDRWQRFDAVPGYVYAMAGDTERARKILAEWTERSRTEWVPKTSLALLHLALGEEEEAIRWLREARQEEDPWLVLVASDPAFRPLSAQFDRGLEISLRLP